MPTAGDISSYTSLALPLPPAPAPNRATGPVADARLKQTAREFEATLLSLVLKEMRQTLEPEGGLFPGDAGDIQGGLFDLYLGRHLADSGGVGLAATIERQATPTPKSVTPPDAHPRNAPVVPGLSRTA